MISYVTFSMNISMFPLWLHEWTGLNMNVMHVFHANIIVSCVWPPTQKTHKSTCDCGYFPTHVGTWFMFIGKILKWSIKDICNLTGLIFFISQLWKKEVFKGFLFHLLLILLSHFHYFINSSIKINSMTSLYCSVMNNVTTNNG